MKRRIELFGLILSVGIVLGSAAAVRAQDKKPADKPAECQYPGSKKLPYEYFAGGK